MNSFFYYVFLVVFIFGVSGCSSDGNCAVVGAIRWDGMFASSKWAENLEPNEYHNRLPFYTTWEDGRPVVNADLQEVMDKEITYAKKAGLDYWAFVYYDNPDWPEADKYNYGLRRYLASKNKNDLNFCLDLQGPHLGKKEKWPETVQEIIEFFSMPTYQKVLADRPLVYMFYVHTFEENFSADDGAKEALSHLKDKAIEAGLGEPYVVAQVFDPAEGADYIDRIGFDAIGAYSAQSDPNYLQKKEYPYSDLAKINKKHWQGCLDQGKEVVPLINAGWDVRPRWWDKELMELYSGQHVPYFTQPNPSELAAHIDSAIKWLTANQDKARANAILIYAWNENDEGSWLVPTLAEGSARLDAIKKVLNKDECVK
jgi:hypothetical protein